MELGRVLEILKKHVDEKALAQELVVELVEPALKQLAAKSDNKIDDMVVEQILAFLKA